MKLAYFAHETVPSELEELATIWGMDITYDDPDILAFNVEETDYSSILAKLEDSGTQIGMYYPSRQTLILPGGIYKE